MELRLVSQASPVAGAAPVSPTLEDAYRYHLSLAGAGQVRGRLMAALAAVARAFVQERAARPGSHPFIVGYRQGAYRVPWGGSAVADPIHEVELGDVDGDGVQELVILEDADRGRAVTVWRWHGWRFSLAWRSPPGPYRDLALEPGEAGAPSAISVAVEP